MEPAAPEHTPPVSDTPPHAAPPNTSLPPPSQYRYRGMGSPNPYDAPIPHHVPGDGKGDNLGHDRSKGDESVLCCNEGKGNLCRGKGFE